MSEKESSSSKTEFQERAAKAIENRPRKPSLQPVQLKLWPEHLRAAPNAVLRSALFGVVEKGKRKAVKEELLASWKGVEMRYTGWQLDQADLEVWTQLVNLSKELLGDETYMNERGFLRSLKRSGGGRNIKWLQSSIGRMQACGVSIRLGSSMYQGSLIHEFAKDDITGRYVVVLNPRLKQLFDDGITLLNFVARKKLKSDLAKWLQGYICSHRATKSKPHRIGLARLRPLCGSSIKRLRDFKRKVIIAMEQLKSAGVVSHWQIVDGHDSPILEFVRSKS